MMRKKGIARRFFLFTALLIAGILLLTCSVLYFVMPGYYLHMKTRALEGNAGVLAESLRTMGSEEACAALIAGFTRINNANVIAFGKEGAAIPALTSPFVSMRRFDNAQYYLYQSEIGNVRAIEVRIASIIPEDADASPSAGQDLDDGMFFMTDIGSTDDVRHAEPSRPEEQSDTGYRISLSGLPPTAAVAGRSAATSVVVTERAVGSAFVDRIIVSGTLQPIDEAKQMILSLIPYLLLISLLVGLILAYFYARGLTRPIVAISDATVLMRSMDENARSNIRTEDELGQLSENLDTMYESLLYNIASLREQMGKANRLERARAEFMQMTGHELKTPIAALSGVVEGMLDNVGVYKDRDTYLKESKALIDRLARLVHEILGASREDALDRPPAQEEVHLGAAIDSAFAPQAHFIRARGLTIVKEGLDRVITTDEALFCSAAQNLAANAARYTDNAGTIRVKAHTIDGELVLDMENDCPHIPAEELEKLFEPFYTRSYSRDRTQCGTGLGLYIVDQALGRLGMPIRAMNTGNGLLFRITLG